MVELVLHDAYIQIIFRLFYLLVNQSDKDDNALAHAAPQPQMF